MPELSLEAKERIKRAVAEVVAEMLRDDPEFRAMAEEFVREDTATQAA